MTKPTHTPGPWNYHRNHVYAKPTGESQTVATTANGNAFSDAEREANARLIAASPTMFVAIKSALINLALAARQDGSPQGYTRLAIEALTAAEARAEGRRPAPRGGGRDDSTTPPDPSAQGRLGRPPHEES